MSNGILNGNVAGVYLISASLTPSSVLAVTAPTQTFTVSGLKTGDHVVVNPPAQLAGVSVAAARVSAADTLAITFVNPTAGALTPTAGTYVIKVTRTPTNVAATGIID